MAVVVAPQPVGNTKSNNEQVTLHIHEDSEVSEKRKRCCQLIMQLNPEGLDEATETLEDMVAFYQNRKETLPPPADPVIRVLAKPGKIYTRPPFEYAEE